MDSPSPRLRIAAAQISSGSEPQANLATIDAAVREAADRGAQLVALPEASMARFGSDLRSIAEPLDGAMGNISAQSRRRGGCHRHCRNVRAKWRRPSA
jgi:predicted amidohydrolase